MLFCLAERVWVGVVGLWGWDKPVITWVRAWVQLTLFGLIVYSTPSYHSLPTNSLSPVYINPHIPLPNMQPISPPPIPLHNLKTTSITFPSHSLHQLNQAYSGRQICASRLGSFRPVASALDAVECVG